MGPHAPQPPSPTPHPPPHPANPRSTGMCGNGICEVGERSVEGLVEGSCPEDCAAESKVSRVPLGCKGQGADVDACGSAFIPVPLNVMSATC